MDFKLPPGPSLLKDTLRRFVNQELIPVRSDAFMVKFFGGEKSFLAAHRCMQIHGGVSHSGGPSIERFFRDQRSMMITEGPGEVLKMALARTVLKAYA
ncbi:acyl-CoA dehydrogenase family protein [Bradyrhizobium sp. AZCC 2230]|uniref:acyl-CoA dehydrogenase family protein n=1 Tax=Bradyrhizobium sp. AZCC 2230 TaxID=3117021 RepID=UPI002FF02DAE